MEEAKLEANEERLKFQKQNDELHRNNTKLHEENLKLSRHLINVKSDSKTKERTLNKRIEDLTNENNKLKSDGGNQKKRKYNQPDKINTIGNLNKNFNSLEIVIENDDKEGCRKLLDKIKNENLTHRFKKETVLHLAAITGSTEIFQMIINMVEDKSPKDLAGFTPLHKAAMYGYEEINKIK